MDNDTKTLNIVTPEPTTAEKTALWMSVGFLGVMVAAGATAAGIGMYDWWQERKIHKAAQKAMVEVLKN